MRLFLSSAPLGFIADFDIKHEEVEIYYEENIGVRRSGTCNVHLLDISFMEYQKICRCFPGTEIVRYYGSIKRINGKLDFTPYIQVKHEKGAYFGLDTDICCKLKFEE